MADPLDFSAIGFKSGLEIHQQLAGKRLFSAFPAEIEEGEPDFFVSRSLRASVGESGHLDVAAAGEQRKAKMFVYQGFHGVTGLVELDEEPVVSPDQGALETAVMVSKMLSAHLIDEVHVMRKVVVDGSNTSGFQRTMIISTDGSVDDVRVDRVCLEEDSCKIVSRESSLDVYNLSRLGIPLLEITTKPDMFSPTHLQHVAAQIGMILRSTGRVRRGLGTIRQDVNISVRDGARVELKGVQDLELLPVIAENEARRQLGLISFAQMLSKQKVSLAMDEKFSFVTKAFSSSSIKWIASAISSGQDVVAAVVNKGNSFLGHELYDNYRVGTELKGYATSWGFAGIMHTDEDASKYGLSSWDPVFQLTSAAPGDALILVIGEKHTACDMFVHSLRPRVAQLSGGVVSEVRKAMPDGSSQYLRPMPGAARMYPETDVFPVSLQNISVEIPELLSVRLPQLSQLYGIPVGVLEILARNGRLEQFEKWSQQLPPAFVSEVLATKEKELKKRQNIDVDLSAISDELFHRVLTSQVSKDAVDDIITEFATNNSVSWDSYAMLSEQQVRSIIGSIIAKDSKAPFGALMGASMKELSGRVDGQLVSRILHEELKK